MNYYIYLDDAREDDTWFRQHLNTEHWVPCVVRSYEEVIHGKNKLRRSLRRKKHMRFYTKFEWWNYYNDFRPFEHQ